MLQAITNKPKEIVIGRADTPNPQNTELLLRVEKVGICGSDMHIFSGHHPTATFPRIQGHEVSAIVEVSGTGYAGPLVPGDRVSVDPLVPCGSCYACRIGRSNSCPSLQVIGAHQDGFLQEWFAVPADNVYLAAALSADETVLTEPVSVGVQAVHRAGLVAGEQCVILGAGPIGLCTAIAAIDTGSRVLMIDTIGSRLKLARQIGVEETLLASDDALDEKILEWTSGDGPPVVIDAVGHPDVIRQCCKLVSPAGRVVIVGLSDREVSLPIVDFTYKEMTILGSRASARRFPEAIALIARHRDVLRRLITHRFPLVETQAGLEFAIANPSVTSKVVVEL